MTGSNCTLPCTGNATLMGPSSQMCVGTGPGTAAFQNSQTCQIPVCAALNPANGAANTCTGGQFPGASCSITCNNGYTLIGGCSQMCMPANVTANISSPIYQNSQVCQAALCANLSPVNGTAGTCVNKFTNQSCSITCATGYAILGPSSQTCTATGPEASAFPNTQSCVALNASCPTPDLKLFLALCLDTDIQSGCRDQCATASVWMSSAFATLQLPASMIATCILNASAATITPLLPSTVNYVITQVQHGRPICAASNDALRPCGAVALVVAFFTSFLA